jgi:hypothetical protein
MVNVYLLLLLSFQSLWSCQLPNSCGTAWLNSTSKRSFAFHDTPKPAALIYASSLNFWMDVSYKSCKGQASRSAMNRLLNFTQAWPLNVPPWAAANTHDNKKDGELCMARSRLSTQPLVSALRKHPRSCIRELLHACSEDRGRYNLQFFQDPL